MDHELFMRRCLQLARSGAGAVAPNPMVGSVIVHDGNIIGEGYHQRIGDKHAEVNAIESVRPEDHDKLCSSTLYVNLEPCSHYGRTPPCSRRILDEGIPRVVMGAADPNKEVSGGGMKLLQDNEVKVTSGILKEESVQLNRRFYRFHENHRPYIVLKWAQSRDGFMGRKNQRTPISGSISNRLVHRWRSEEAAILVGFNTARIDNPQLTNRLYFGSSPLRIVLDRDLALPDSASVLDGTVPTVVFNRQKTDSEKGVERVKIPFNEDFDQAFWEELVQREIQSVLVEGGAQTLQSFIDRQLWDEARVITNRELQLNQGVKAPSFKGQLTSTFCLEQDEIAVFTPNE